MIILFIIVWGMAAGWIAQLIMGEDTNWGQALGLGLAGSLIGGLLASLLSGDGLELRLSGIIGMTIILARDLAAIGVRVNCIAPGTIGTQVWDMAPAELRAKLEAQVPFPRRFGEPAEFAALAEHMITNRYLNGQVIRLDGAIRFDPK